MIPAIEAQGLTKFFGPFVAVQDVSFAVWPGQVVALLGPNGAGKSTTMRMLTGYVAASAGRARIGGCDVMTDRLRAAALVGYLPENGPLYSDMTPRALLRFFGEARGLTGPHLAERVGTVVRQCEIDSIADKPIAKLSKGLRQRVGLAQALLHDPAVLIMDEPTAGLDPNQIRQFRSLVQQLRQTKTLLISTHILSEADVIADRALLVHAGRLVFDGTPGDLRQAGSLEDTFYKLTVGREGSA